MNRNELKYVVAIAIGWLLRNAIDDQAVVAVVSFVIGAAIMGILALMSPATTEDFPDSPRKEG